MIAATEVLYFCASDCMVSPDLTFTLSGTFAVLDGPVGVTGAAFDATGAVAGAAAAGALFSAAGVGEGLLFPAAGADVAAGVLAGAVAGFDVDAGALADGAAFVLTLFGAGAAVGVSAATAGALLAAVAPPELTGEVFVATGSLFGVGALFVATASVFELVDGAAVAAGALFGAAAVATGAVFGAAAVGAGALFGAMEVDCEVADVDGDVAGAGVADFAATGSLLVGCVAVSGGVLFDAFGVSSATTGAGFEFALMAPTPPVHAPGVRRSAIRCCASPLLEAR